jgi:hypothetical protein
LACAEVNIVGQAGIVAKPFPGCQLVSHDFWDDLVDENLHSFMAPGNGHTQLGGIVRSERLSEAFFAGRSDEWQQSLAHTIYLTPTIRLRKFLLVFWKRRSQCAHGCERREGGALETHG